MSSSSFAQTEQVDFDSKKFIKNFFIDLSKNQPLKVPSGVPPYTTTKFGDNPSKGLGGVGKQTDKQL